MGGVVNRLSQYKLPDIHTISLLNCGHILEDVRHMLNTAVPNSINELYLFCNSPDMDENSEGKKNL